MGRYLFSDDLKCIASPRSLTCHCVIIINYSILPRCSDTSFWMIVAVRVIETRLQLATITKLYTILERCRNCQVILVRTFYVTSRARIVYKVRQCQ